MLKKIVKEDLELFRSQKLLKQMIVKELLMQSKLLSKT